MSSTEEAAGMVQGTPMSEHKGRESLQFPLKFAKRKRKKSHKK